MRKAHILTTEKISKKALEEVAELIPAIYTVEQTTELIPKKWNPYHSTWWGDFNWLRSQFNYGYDTRCYVTSQEKLVKQGISKKHIGMYDLTDSDGVLDFYIALPKELDKRAKANGFKTNFAWLYCHETSHGKEQLKGTPDRVHTMEAQGRLKELLAEYRRDDMEEQISFLRKLINSLIASFKPKGLQPLVQRKADLVVKKMAEMGKPVRIVEGYRSIERQNELYAQGRTTAGNIVTNAKGGESFHNYGVAVDFVFRQYGYEAPESDWKILGKVAESVGFAWGGRWKGFVDKPHCEMTLGYKLSDFQNGKVDKSKYL